MWYYKARTVRNRGLFVSMATPTLSDKTKLNLALGTALTALLFVVGAAFTLGYRIATFEGKITAIETRQTGGNEDLDAVATEMQGIKTAQNETNINVAKLSTQMANIEELLRQRTVVSVTPRSANRTVVVSHTPSQPQNQNPQPQQPSSQPTPQPEPEPNPLQPAATLVQRILLDAGRLL